MTNMGQPEKLSHLVTLETDTLHYPKILWQSLIACPTKTILSELHQFNVSLSTKPNHNQLAITHSVVSGLLAVRPSSFLDFESAVTFVSCLLGK